MRRIPFNALSFIKLRSFIKALMLDEMFGDIFVEDLLRARGLQIDCGGDVRLPSANRDYLSLRSLARPIMGNTRKDIL